MRDAICLYEKELTIEDVKYQIKDINFMPGTNKFYLTLENEDGFTNVSLKKILPFLKKQL